jgi:hypothetical protein
MKGVGFQVQEVAESIQKGFTAEHTEVAENFSLSDLSAISGVDCLFPPRFLFKFVDNGTLPFD